MGIGFSELLILLAIPVALLVVAAIVGVIVFVSVRGSRKD